jgi:hypothetical protein
MTSLLKSLIDRTVGKKAVERAEALEHATRALQQRVELMAHQQAKAAQPDTGRAA